MGDSSSRARGSGSSSTWAGTWESVDQVSGATATLTAS